MALPRRAAAAALAAAVLVSVASCRKDAAVRGPRVTLTPCRLEGVTPQTKCGTFEVWEDRAAKKGRRLKLKIAVIPALAQNPAPDPLFLLAGGPGQAITEAAGPLLWALERVRRQRDIVLVDQRGTGGSHPLDCTITPEDAPLARQLADEGFAGEAIKKCLAGYDADPRLYTTPIAMNDLDEVRAALGYDRINLWGGSYGTRAALVYLRDHRAHVRTAILDGVAPFSIRLPLYMGRDGQRALDLLFAHCAADAGCAQAFPDLPARFRDLLARLRARPARVTVADPVTGVPTEVTISHDAFVSALRGVLYLPDVAALIPLTIDRAVHGDFGPFVAQAASLQNGFSRSMSLGLFFSVACAEDVPFIAPGEFEKENAGTFVGARLMKEIASVCTYWPRGTLDDAYRQPIQSDVPTLLLSGELDPVTPPVWADEVARHLTHARHVVVPGVGHGATSQGCVPELIGQFLGHAKPEALDPTCVSRLQRPPFFVSFAGPTP